MSDLVSLNSLPAAFPVAVKVTETWEDASIGGGGIKVQFPNGWGLSIIRHTYSYGGTQGLFEAMILDTNGDLFDEPRGWLSQEDVFAFMREVAAR